MRPVAEWLSSDSFILSSTSIFHQICENTWCFRGPGNTKIVSRLKIGIKKITKDTKRLVHLTYLLKILIYDQKVL